MVSIFGSGMAFIDGTVVNIAIPALQNAFQASVSQVQWVIEAYSLSLAALLLMGGSLGDLYGRRVIFLTGIFIFTSASIGCGLATTMLSLITARAIQGIGAALLIPGSLALISASFSEEERGRAIGTWAGFTAIMTAVGPVLGGWLVEYSSWRWIFFINVPLAITIFTLTLFYVCESKNKNFKSLDFAGAILATLGLGAIIFGLIQWEHGIAITTVVEVSGFCLLLGFFWVEAHADSPMVPLTIFRSRNFSGANLLTFFLYFALYGLLFFFPLDLIQIQGYTATEAGAALLPLVLLMFVLSRWSGGLVSQFGSRLPLVVGPVVAAMGFALFALVDISHSYWTSFFPATVILGLGMAISVAPLTTVVMNAVSADYLGAASGINNAISRVAGLLAIAIFGLIIGIVFNEHLIPHLKMQSIPLFIQEEIMRQKIQLANIKTNDAVIHGIIQESFIRGFKTIAWISTSLALMSSLSALVFIRGKKNKS